MIIYHGQPSPKQLERCRESAPSFEHGEEWCEPTRYPDHDERYIIDNGAYVAAQSGEKWDKREWYELLTATHDMKRPPDFVVLPDVYDDAERTQARHRRFVEIARSHGYDYYSVGQPGLPPVDQVEFAESIGASGVFLGGCEIWKRAVARDFRELTDSHGLKLHIGQPGNLRWANSVGVDSVDTTSIVRNQAYERLTRSRDSQLCPTPG